MFALPKIAAMVTGVTCTTRDAMYRGLMADTPIAPLATDPAWGLRSTLTEIASWLNAETFAGGIIQFSARVVIARPKRRPPMPWRPRSASTAQLSPRLRPASPTASPEACLRPSAPLGVCRDSFPQGSIPHVMTPHPSTIPGTEPPAAHAPRVAWQAPRRGTPRPAPSLGPTSTAWCPRCFLQPSEYLHDGVVDGLGTLRG